MQKRFLAMCLVIAMMVTMLVPNYVAKAATDYSSLAADLPLNGAWSGDYLFTETQKEAYYRVTIPADGKFTLKVMSYMENFDWKLYNQDWSKEYDYGSVRYGTETAPKTKEYSYGLSAGTYYIAVNGYYTGRYRMYGAFTNWNTTDQGADSFDSPMNLPMSTQVTGAITKTDTEDWYRITVPVSGAYSIKITGYGDVNYHFYNSDLSKEIDHSNWDIDGSETAPDTQTYDYTLSAGTYLIKLVNEYSQSRYTLTWYNLTPANCTHEYQDTYIGATYLAKGYTQHTCKKCGHTYRDNYSAKKTLSQGSIYSLVSGKKKLVLTYLSIYEADKLQIRYSRDKKFKKGVKTVKVKNVSYGRKTIKKLSRRKRYYVQVRGYKKVGNKTVYGKWSLRKSVKIK